VGFETTKELGSEAAARVGKIIIIINYNVFFFFWIICPPLGLDEKEDR